MKKFVGLLFVSLVALVLIATVASAQDSADEDAGDGMTLSLKNSIPISATLDIVVDGKIVRVTVPVQFSIDTQTIIDSEAFDNAPDLISKVGDVIWEIESIEEVGNEMTAKYSDPLKTETGKFVVVTVSETNMHDEEYEVNYTEIRGIDSEGNLFEKHKSGSSYVETCSSLNPGVTQTCQYLFEVLEDTEITGLDIKTADFGKVFASPQ